jgi:hypothetical protein
MYACISAVGELSRQMKRDPGQLHKAGYKKEIDVQAFIMSFYSLRLQREIIPGLLLHLLSGGDSDNTNLDSVFCHLTFESFFEREEGGVDCIF